MSKKIKEDQWVWVVVQDPGGNEQFLGQRDETTHISFIPTWLEKEAAVECLDLLAREQGVKYEVQAIEYKNLAPKAAEAGFKLFVLDASGKILEQIEP
ncbi:MAG: hypothetical protein JRL30_23860 [Deltaproteobacteria bacterium]|nr:hypothetical protein [Deltaproteobacteria bacterium]